MKKYISIKYIIPIRLLSKKLASVVLKKVLDVVFMDETSVVFMSEVVAISIIGLSNLKRVNCHPKKTPNLENARRIVFQSISIDCSKTYIISIHLNFHQQIFLHPDPYDSVIV